MELCQRERLSQLVEELTTSGQPQLNQDKVKELKKISKVSNDCIDHVYHSVMSQLNQEHAEIRLSAFQIACELFSRSHHFRTLLVDNLQEFLELTVETDTEQPLPPPKEVARKLRSLAIQTVQSWQTSYGSAYKKLELGYHFLKQVKKVDFQDAEARTVAERRREEERQRKMERIYKARVEAAAKNMEESYHDIEATLTEMESCVKLLFPEFGLIDLHTGNSCPSDSQSDKSCRSDDEEPCCSRNLTENKSRGEDWSSIEEKVDCRDDKNNPGKESTADRGMMEKKGSDTEEENGERRWEDERKEDQEEEEGLMEEEREGAEQSSEEEEDEELANEDSFIRSSGLISHTYSLDVNLSPVLHVKETEDNEPVVSTMMELHRLISTKHLPAVQGWVQVFTKSHAEPQLLRRALSLKKSLEAALHKHEELHIDCKTRVRKVCQEQSVITATGKHGMKVLKLKREQQSDSDRAAGVWRCLVITVGDQFAAPAGPALR
ncbi:hypothetical protein CRENBAI_003702 [Crenichthys baileyi]|uniref:UV-stimulated scaffold protein A n=1 Tax=Crenichthys baileyi TaxID=28760 RepID=A0AAV9SLJ1_9TELE